VALVTASNLTRPARACGKAVAKGIAAIWMRFVAKSFGISGTERYCARTNSRRCSAAKAAKLMLIPPGDQAQAKLPGCARANATALLRSLAPKPGMAAIAMWSMATVEIGANRSGR